MSNMHQTKQQRVIETFQSLLRSGKDYSTEFMYETAGESVCVVGESARRIINKYYRGVVDQDMIDFIEYHNCSPKKQIELFAEKFSICNRESRLIIRYIKMR